MKIFFEEMNPQELHLEFFEESLEGASQKFSSNLCSSFNGCGEIAKQ